MSSQVTVVIPAFDAGGYVFDAVESVINQTENPLECIVVDDGSTDNTCHLALKAGATVVLRTARRGVAHARNVGARQAKGRYLAFLDADDVWEPEKLERQMAVMRETPSCGLVYCGLQYVNENLQPLYSYEAPAPEAGLRSALMLRPPPIGLAQTGVVPTTIFHELNGFDERLSMCADLDLLLRIVASYKIVEVREPLVRYRQHAAQMSKSSSSSFESDIRLIASKLRDDLVQFRPFRRRMLARMNLLLGMSSWTNHDVVKAISYWAKSASWSPRELVGELVERVGSRRAARL